MLILLISFYLQHIIIKKTNGSLTQLTSFCYNSWLILFPPPHTPSLSAVIKESSCLIFKSKLFRIRKWSSKHSTTSRIGLFYIATNCSKLRYLVTGEIGFSLCLVYQLVVLERQRQFSNCSCWKKLATHRLTLKGDFGWKIYLRNWTSQNGIEENVFCLKDNLNVVSETWRIISYHMRRCVCCSVYLLPLFLGNRFLHFKNCFL